MTMEFADAAPVRTPGAGRKAADNPFTDIIAEISLKTVEENGETRPVAKSYVLEHSKDADERAKEINKVKRQLRAAGSDDVTVYVHDTPKVNPVNKTASETKTVITFWTTAKVRRPRTAAAPADAATPGDTAAQ
jgi:hypothetical protein